MELLSHATSPAPTESGHLATAGSVPGLVLAAGVRIGALGTLEILNTSTNTWHTLTITGTPGAETLVLSAALPT